MAAAVLIVLVFVVAGAAWLVNTESGLRWAWAGARAWTGIGLSADSLRGTLAGPLEAQELRIRSGDTVIDATQLTLDWQPLALLKGTLSFRQLAGSEINVRLPEAKPEEGEQQPFSGLNLPFAIRFADVRLNNLKVLRGAETLFAIDNGELSARFEQAGLKLAHLVIKGPWGRFEAEGDIGTLPAMAINLTTDWQVSVAQLAQPIAGAGRIRGTLAKPRFQQRVTEPFVMEAEGGLDWQAEPLSWDARLKTAGVRLDQLRGDWRPVTVAGTITGEGQAAAFVATSVLSVDDPELGRWGIDSRLQAGELWNLEQLELQQVDGPARIQAKGVWMPAFDTPDLVEDVRLTLDWQDLSWPLPDADPLAGSPQGKLTVSGTLSDYTVDASLQLKRPGEPPATLHLLGAGNREQLEAESLQLAWLDGEAAGSGRLEWADGLAWDANLNGSGFDPAALLPAWPGEIGFAIQGGGILPPEGIATANITVDSLSGNLRGEPLAGSAAAQLAGTRFVLEHLQLSIGTASLSSSGVVEESWTMAWQLEAPQLGIVHPELQGSIRASGRLDGARGSPRIRLNASAERLAVRDIRSVAANLHADIDLAGEVPWDAELEIAEFSAPHIPPLNRVTITANGSAPSHSIRAEAAGSDIFFTQTAIGGYASGSWSGQLTDGAVRGLPPATWQQSAPASLSADSSGIVLKALCWSSAEARACTSVEGSLGQLQLSQFPLTTISPFIADTDVRIDGVVNASIEADAASGYLDAEVAAMGAGVTWGEGERDLAFDIKTALLVAKSDHQGTSADLEISAERGGHLRARVRSSSTLPFGSDAPIDGTIELNANRLGWVSLLVSDVADPEGQVTGNFRVAGTMGSPEIDGSLLLEDGSAFIIPAGIRIQPIRLELRAVGEDELSFSGEAVSGGGQITLEGRLQRTAEAWRVSGMVSGEDFEASQLPYARVFVSPDLQLEVVPGLVTVTGRLHVPRADIELRELPQTIQRSPDVVVIREDVPTAARPGWRTRTDVTVTFGDRIALEGYGFSGRLSGRLAISEKPGQAATANGELRILEGRYEAYGQELTISEGRLLFAASPLANPAIDLRAIRVVEEVTAGIEVTGQLKDPEIRLFSEPPMEESDALAYLIVGRPLSRASRAEGDLLYNAALSLGLRGGNFLAQQIGSEFGIEEVEVERDPQSEAASLVLGTHLSPRLYLQYVVVFAEAVNRVRIRYDLGTNWTLEAESGEQAGTDLFYTIER
ncbi:translocation/assembly module TamB domain-containing protein [Thiohalomonas denitrificans]|uniref:translocation/assembly module TamB domain-containing protein n=1 Tax=Thiohalomonas denitrificans TaxID=415747 RepID=UPI0026E9E7D6|nr:translocation/assembly module TamB domain-containing protein [Thiohalomonas denitrificans]